MIDSQRTETMQERIARVDARIARYRADGAAYVVLCQDGRALVAMPGKLRAVLRDLQARESGAELVELADPQSRNQIIRWALQPRPIETKGSN